MNTSNGKNDKIDAEEDGAVTDAHKSDGDSQDHDSIDDDDAEDDYDPGYEQVIEQPRQPGRFRRFVRSVFSHLGFAGAAFALASYFGYLNNHKILRDVSDTVCAAKMLGGYMSKPVAGETNVAGKKTNTQIAHNDNPQQIVPANQNQSAERADDRRKDDRLKTASQTLPAVLPAGRTPTSGHQLSPVRTGGEEAAGDNSSGNSASASGNSAGQVSSLTDKPPRQPPAKVKIPEKSSHASEQALPSTNRNKEQPSRSTKLSNASHNVARHDNSAASPPKNAQTAQQEPVGRPTASNRPQGHKQASIKPATPTQPETLTANRQAAANESGTATGPTRDNDRPVRDSASAQQSLHQAWNQARRAYASGQPNADNLYKTLIRRFPDVADLPGELGNIYYRQGKLREAARYFYEAAVRLVQNNQPDRAACLLGVLQRIDPARATALRQKTSATCPTRP